MIILQYAAFLLPTCKDQWTGIHEQSGARITCKKFCENRQWILLDTVYYHDCGSNLYPYNFESLRELLGFEEEFNKEIEKAANHSPEDDEFF